MDSVFDFIAGKAADSVISHAGTIVNKIRSSQIVDTATEQQAKEFLLNKYGDTVFYNDLDSFVSRNSIIPHLISSLRGESALQANNEDEFVESNLKAFVSVYSRYKYEIVTLGSIRSAFREIFTIVFDKTVSVDPYSDLGKIQSAMYSFESSRKKRDEEILSISRSDSEKIDQILSALSTSASPSIIKTVGSDGIADADDYTEEVTKLTDEIKVAENTLQKKGLFKEAIEEYQKLQRKILLQLRSCPANQVDKLICSLSSNFALCYANIGKLEQARDYLLTAPKDAAGKDKTLQYVYAAIQAYYDSSQNLSDAQAHVEKALLIDPDYHNAFLLYQLIKAKQKARSIDEIISEIDDRFLPVLTDPEQSNLIAEYHMHKGLIFMEDERFDEALECFENAGKNGYDSDIVNVDIAGVYYAKAVHNVPKGKKTILPEYGCSDLLKALDHIKPIILSDNQAKLHPLVRNRSLMLYGSACTLIGMPLELEPPEKFLDDPEIDNEVKRAIILSSSVPLPDKYTNLLNEEDKQFLKAKSYIHNNDAVGFKEYVEALITINGFASVPLLNLLLQNCIVLKTASDYWKYRDQASAAGLSSRLLRVYDAECYELESKPELAYKIYYEIAHEEFEYEILRRASFFFTRNNYKDEAIELYCRINELRKSNATYIYDSDTFYSDAIYYLISNDLSKAKELIETLDTSTISPFVFYRLSFSVYSKFNDWAKMLYACEKAYELSHEFPDGFNRALGLMVFQRYEEAIIASQELIQIARNIDEKVKCLWLLSDLYLFNADYENSFERAKEAHLLTKTNPYEKSHQAFFGRAIRTGHSEGLQDILEFKEEHPVVADWIKTIQLPENENDGEKIADMLSMASSGRLAAENRRRESEKIALYKQGILPLHFLFNSYGNSLFMISEFAIKHKLIVSEGDINKAEKELETLSDSLVVDMYSLIILEISDCLYLLNEIPHVYIPYFLISKLQQFFLSSALGTTQHIENILSWIQSSSNVSYEADGIPWETSKLTNVFSEDFISCCNIARQHSIPYLTCETVAKRIQDTTPCEYSDVNLISIPTVCAKISENLPEQCAKARYRLLKYCTFISFSATDIVNAIIDNDYNITEEIVSRFMICRSTYDVASFSNVYLQAIAILFQYDEDVAEEFVKVVLNDAHRVWRRGTYARDAADRFNDKKAEYQAATINAYAVQIYYGIALIYKQLDRVLPEELNTLHQNLFQCAVSGIARIEIQKMLEPLRNPIKMN